MLLVCLRWIGTLLLLLVISRQRLIDSWPVLKPSLPFLIAMGALGLTAFNGFFYVAAHTTTALNIGIIQGSIPVFVLAGSVLLFRNRVNLLQITGIAVTIAGVVLVTAAGDLEKLLALSFQFGDVLMIIACLLYAGYSLGLQRCPSVDRLALFTVFSAGALLASFPLLGYEILANTVQWPTARGWVLLGLITLLPSFLAQLAFIKSVDMIGADRAGIFFNLVPVFAAIIAVSLLGEVFRWYHGIALILVLGGIGLSEWGKRHI